MRGMQSSNGVGTGHPDVVPERGLKCPPLHVRSDNTAPRALVHAREKACTGSPVSREDLGLWGLLLLERKLTRNERGDGSFGNWFLVREGQHKPS